MTDDSGTDTAGPLDASLPVGSAASVTRNVVGIYERPDTDGSLISQLVFGADVRILEHALSDDPQKTTLTMVRVKGPDRYEGWVRARALAPWQDQSDYPQTTIAALIADIYEAPKSGSRIVTKLSVGSNVVLARHDSEREFTPVRFPDGKTYYTHRGNLSSTYLPDAVSDVFPSLPTPNAIKDMRAQVTTKVAENSVVSALRLIGTPYFWGGTTPFGIDCSGLTQLAYKITGIQLMRDAWMQMIDKRFVLVESEIDLEDAVLMPGDLVFFSAAGSNVTGVRRIVHVGLAVGDGSFVHAAGKGRGVMVSECDDPEWSSIYAGAARLSTDADLSIDSA